MLLQSWLEQSFIIFSDHQAFMFGRDRNLEGRSFNWHLHLQVDVSLKGGSSILRSLLYRQYRLGYRTHRDKDHKSTYFRRSWREPQSSNSSTSSRCLFCRVFHISRYQPQSLEGRTASSASPPFLLLSSLLMPFPARNRQALRRKAQYTLHTGKMRTCGAPTLEAFRNSGRRGFTNEHPIEVLVSQQL